MSKGRRIPPGSPGTTIGSLVTELRNAAPGNPAEGLLGMAAALLEDLHRRMAPATDARGLVQLHVASLLSARTGQPLVTIGIGDTQLQVSPEAARAHALAILEASDAAESDALLMAFAADRLDMELPQAGQLLNEFRRYREKRRGEEARSA